MNGIIEDKEVELEEDDRYFATMIRPKQLTGNTSYEIGYESNFEDTCLVLSKFINQPVKTLTTKEYFTLIRHYNEQTKKR